MARFWRIAETTLSTDGGLKCFSFELIGCLKTGISALKCVDCGEHSAYFRCKPYSLITLSVWPIDYAANHQSLWVN